MLIFVAIVFLAVFIFGCVLFGRELKNFGDYKK